MSQVETAVELQEYAVPVSLNNESLYAVSAGANSAVPSTRADSIAESIRPLTIQEQRGQHADPSLSNTILIITVISFITCLGSMLTGIITVAIPVMALDLHLTQSLILWPASIYALACGCTLLLSGAAADVVGSRRMFLIGCFMQGVFTLASGLARDGTQLIVFRGFAGVAISMCMPASVSIITTTFRPGPRRNAAFASFGGGQPVGFALGLVVGGVITSTIGWRWGFFILATGNIVLLVLALFVLPKAGLQGAPNKLKALATEVDWVGALIASLSLAGLSFVFAAITGNLSTIRHPLSIAVLALSLALIPTFILWVRDQERRGRPALIPNRLWRNATFTSICLACMLAWGSLNALEQLCTFYFQYAQRLTPVQAAVRFLPAPVSGACVNVLMGVFVQHVRADYIAIAASLLSVAPGIVMANAHPGTSYWASAFPATLLNPMGTDALWTIANLVITSSFSPREQGLAGGVFNTVAQIGKSTGLAIASVIANSVTAGSGFGDKHSPDALMEGYAAAFWYCFALSAACLLVSAVGLRKVGKVGLKQD